MLLTIHNLPAHMQYSDIKQLLFTKCGLTELILDNLVNEGNSKKVTIGVTDDSEAAIVVRKINGLFLSGQQLYVEDVRNKLESDQPYRPQASSRMAPNRFGVPEKQSFSTSGNQRYEPENQHFGASNQRQFDASDSKNFGGPKSQRLSAPKQQRFGAPENQKFSAPDSQRFGVPKNQPLGAPKQHGFGAPKDQKFIDSQSFGAPKNQRLGAPKQQRFGATENQKYSAPDSQSFGANKNQGFGAPEKQNFSAPDNQRFDSPKDQWFDSPKDQWFGASKNQMVGASKNLTPKVLAPDNQQFGLPDVPFAAEQGFLAPGYMQMPMNTLMMPNMPSSSMYMQPGGMMPGNPYVGTFMPQGQDENFMGFQPNNPVGWGDNQHQPTGPGLQEPDEEPEPFDYNHGNRDYSSTWDTQGIEDEMPMDRGILRNSSRPRMPEHIRSRSPRHGYGGPPNTDYDRKYYQQAENYPAPPIRSFNGGRETDERGRGSIRTDRRPGVEARGRGEVSRGDRSSWGRQDSTRSEWTGVRRPNLKRKSLEPVTKRPSKREKHTALLMEDAVLWTNKMNNREESYRGMATSNIAKEVGIKYAVPFVTLTQLKLLKAAIRKRIDLLLGTDYHDSPAQVTEIYRKIYPMTGDEKLFSTTIEESRVRELAAAPKKEPVEFSSNGDKLVKTPEVQAVNQGHTSAPKKEPVEFSSNGDKLVKNPEVQAINQGNTSGAGVAKKTKIPKAPKIPKAAKIPVLKKPKLAAGELLPSYPNASKKVYNKLKNLQTTEKVDSYWIDDLTNAVIDEELNAIVEAIQQKLPKPVTEAETVVYNYIKEKTFEEYIQILKLTCIKRVRNIRTNLLMRVFGDPKLPNRTSMTNFLKHYSVFSLKSSVKGKFYVVTLDSYQDYDTLLALDNPTIDGMPVQFKPMHLTGPKEKLNKRQFKEAKTNFVKQQLQGCYGAGTNINEQQHDDIEETEPNPIEETEPNPNDETFPDYELNLDHEPDDEPMVDECTMNDTVDDIPEDLLNVNEDELEDY